ncbi:MAG: hypothetical protein LQ349_004737, partial [Xanthoria aureola]
WKCCRPRVLTFDEFLAISPCTTGKHSTVDDTPAVEPTAKPQDAEDVTFPPPKPIAVTNGHSGIPLASQRSQAPQQPISAPLAPSPESESDDPSVTVPANKTCRRRGCNVTSSADTASAERGDENCVYHPGLALFHEGSKGWTCCKRRVLDFDDFMKIEGCKRKKRHLFVGSGKKDVGEEALQTVRYEGYVVLQYNGDVDYQNGRHDFYQTPTTVIASLYLKKVDKQRSKIDFASPTEIHLDLPTTDMKRYKTIIPLFAPIDIARSTSKIMGTKIELTLVKFEPQSWAALRSDEGRTCEITQLGPAGRA